MATHSKQTKEGARAGRARKQGATVETDVPQAGEFRDFTVKKPIGRPPKAFSPGDLLITQVREPKPGDVVFQKIGSEWYFAEVWRSQRKGLCTCLWHRENGFDRRRGSSAILPSDALAVVLLRVTVQSMQAMAMMAR